MEFLPPQLEEYIEAHTRPAGEHLESLERETYQKVLMPRMVSGHLQGQVLRMLSLMIRPKRILEIGTFTGYSAICMADGLAEDGRLITLDINEELEAMVKKYIGASTHAAKIDYRLGDATQIIPTLNETWDLVFIDADKENYARYFDMVIGSVRPGGFIIADNVLWSGKVLQDKMDKDTRAIADFNDKVQADPRVENVLFAIRDGLMVMRKL